MKPFKFSFVAITLILVVIMGLGNVSTPDWVLIGWGAVAVVAVIEGIESINRD